MSPLGLESPLGTVPPPDKVSCSRLNVFVQCTICKCAFTFYVNVSKCVHTCVCVFVQCKIFLYYLNSPELIIKSRCYYVSLGLILSH